MAVRDVVQAAAGVGGGDKLYVEDVFSTYLYTGNGASQTIYNNIALGDGPTNGTMFHLTGDGPTITDSAPLTNTVTLVGTPVIDTTVKKYGAGSIYITSSNKVVADTNRGLGPSNFTAECWVKTTTTGTNGIFHIDAGGSSDVSGITVMTSSIQGTTNGSSWDIAFSWSGASDDAWHHIALVRNGSTIVLYLDGVSVGSSSVGSSSIFTTNAGNINVGQRATGGSFTGYIDDFRLTLGRAVYTSNFTPPTEALPIDTLVTGEGGLVWLKSRAISSSHWLYDTERGVTKELLTNSTGAQSTESNGLTSFNSDGFTFGTRQSQTAYGASASWTFRKAPKFFDIVTWTGDGVSGRQISHNLGSKPGFIVVKRTDTGNDPYNNWRTAHINGDILTAMDLNTTSDASTTPWFLWSDGATATSAYAAAQQTSTYFTVGSNVSINGSGGSFVAYLFANDAGGFGDDGEQNVISCGSFTTDGSANATVNLGFEPQWLITKRTDSTSNWFITDVMRGMPVGSGSAFVSANQANAEATGTFVWSPTATGLNVSFPGAASATYIYIAIRRPMKTPESGTEVFVPYANTSITNVGSTSTSPLFNAGFVVDAAWEKARNGGDGWYEGSRLTGSTYRKLQLTDAELTSAGIYWDSNVAGWNYNSEYGIYFFKRAPGFMDVVAYSGTGVVRTVAHNLGVAPELMIFKRRNGISTWPVFSKAVFDISASGRLLLNETTQYQNSSAVFNSTAPTSSVFTLGTSPDSNASSGTYIAYLFASCPGVSKVGSYSGTGTTQTINCGFSSGARFVLIKRTDSTGDWYVWDSARGIVAGNDPLLFLNDAGSEFLNTDYIDPAASGFEISSSAPAAINASGGSYIFLAIA